MPSDRDDAPPGAGPSRSVRQLLADIAFAAPSNNAYAVADAMLRNIPTWPDAARWRLIGWLAAGLEPTEAMCHAALEDERMWRKRPRPSVGMAMHIKAALAAAREAGDGS